MCGHVSYRIHGVPNALATILQQACCVARAGWERQHAGVAGWWVVVVVEWSFLCCKRVFIATQFSVSAASQHAAPW